MNISPALKQSLESAVNRAKDEFHECVTVEHVLYAMIHQAEIIDILEACGGNIDQLKDTLELFLSEHIPVIPESLRSDNTDGPIYSISLQLSLQIAANHAMSSEKDQLKPVHLLVAFFRTKESHAVYFLEQQKITRLDIVRFISHPPQPDQNTTDSKEKTDVKETILINLNEKAKAGKIDPLVGRNEELNRAIHILSRRRKNNPVFVGDAGVGKTACAEGLALKIVQKEVPKAMKDATIYSLDLSSLLAGTRYRGDFEERFKKIIEKIQSEKDAIVLIDEIHTIIGAGAVSGGGMDATSVLKPYLSEGTLRCIGTTTQKEYRRIFEKDHAMARRFQRVDLSEPNEDETLKIIKGVIDRYQSFHKVTYTDDAVSTAVHLSSAHIQQKSQPDKAIDVIDEIGAEVKLSTRKKPVVTAKDVEQLIVRIAKIPEITVEKDDKTRLKNLEKELKAHVFGQEDTINQLVETVQLSRSGLGAEDKPIGSFLFAGPTGVGKTELAKQLANALGIAFIRFDMSEYMEKHTVSRLIGSPPGYVGYDEGGQLTEAVVKTPHAVVLLDEIEKAHIDITNILLQVMDHATLTDNNGRKADFRHVVLIMTTNQGAKDSQATPIGFEKPEHEDRSKKALEKFLAPEFRNRLTAICQFNRLPKTIIESIVHKNLKLLEDKLAPKNVYINVLNSAVEYFIEHGYTPDLGARPMERIIQTKLAQPLSKELLFGKLKKGGKATISASKNELKITIK